MTERFDYLTPNQHARFERFLLGCTYCQIYRIVACLSQQARIAPFPFDRGIAATQLQQLYDHFYSRYFAEQGFYRIPRDVAESVAPREVRQVVGS